MSDDSEMKTRAPRVAKSFMVRINEDPFAEVPRWNIVTARDISASGILFNYDRYMEPGSRVQFKISLPVCGTVVCEGEVVRNVTGAPRVLAQTEPVVSAVAAVFHDVSAEDLQAMEGYFEQTAAEQAAEKEASGAAKPPSDMLERAQRMERQYITRVRQDELDPWDHVAVQNISETGLLFNSTKLYEIGEVLFLRMALPFAESEVLCRAEVARAEDRTRPTATIKTFGIGVKFLDLDKEARAGIRKFSG